MMLKSAKYPAVINLDTPTYSVLLFYTFFKYSTSNPYGVYRCLSFYSFVLVLVTDSLTKTKTINMYTAVQRTDQYIRLFAGTLNHTNH